MQSQTISGFTLSPQQKYLWLLQQNTSAYLTQFSISLEGSLQPEILKATLHKIISRHQILRTNFCCFSSMKVPVMVVEDNTNLCWQDIDLSDWDESQKSARITDLFEADRLQNFDLEKGPLLRFSLIKLALDKHLILVSLPALCADTWTVKNLVREISILYAGFLSNEEIYSEEVMQYVQVAEWQNQLLMDEESATADEYWCQQKPSIPYGLNLPFETKSLQPSKFDSESVKCRSEVIDPQVAARFTTLSKKYNTSLQVILLACWQILFWRLTGESNVVIGWKSDRREYEELHDVLGLLAVWLPITSHLSPDLRFFEVLEFVQTTIDAAEEWQDYFVPQPIENAESLVLPIGFEFEQFLEEQLAGDVSFSLRHQYNCTEPFKVKLTCTQKNNLLEANFYYDANYFSVDTIQNLSRQFQTLLANAAEDFGSTISQLEILSQSERQQLLFEFNQTQTDFALDKCVHQIFEEQVEKIPDDVAVVYENQQLTYVELNTRANQLAHYLQQLGVGPETIVCLHLERSLETIVCLLGVLKAGGAYLPIDPALPDEGVNLRLQDAQASVLLTQKRLAGALSTQAVRTVVFDEEWPQIAQCSKANPVSQVVSENLAYVLFTSGSTGRPKGVAIEHRALLNYLKAIFEKIDLPTGANFANVSTFAADLGNTVIFPALCTGGCLHVISQEQASDPTVLADYFHRYSIDCLKIVPSHLSALLAASSTQSILPRQSLILGGEAASWELVEHIQQRHATCQIFNHYGPTETTVGALTYAIEYPRGSGEHPKSETVPIGRPLANVQVYVLDKQLQPVPMGIPGELYIGGSGLARGYFNRPELTRTRFIANPFIQEVKGTKDEIGSSLHSEQLYKTGDLVRYLSDGNLEFLGRLDNQVKVRGFRIELGEIEAVLRQHPGVRDIVVLAREDEPGDKRLVAYVVPHQRKVPGISDLQLFLRKKLPEFMVPSVFMLLKRLPLTANGKVDRQSLPLPDINRPDLEENFVAPRTPVEASLAGIWADVLRLERVGIHDNFFELGGHSLLVTQVVSRLRDAFEVDLSLSDFFEAPTVANVAVLVVQKMAGEVDEEMLAQAFAELEQLSEEEAQAVLVAEEKPSNQEGGMK
ncbi:MAG: amino acid adenylation domain-containing protein [Cyanobacteria bacterium P01_D01_bin.44]